MTGEHAAPGGGFHQELWAAFCRLAEAADSGFSPTTQGARALAKAFSFSHFVAATCTRHPRMALDLITGGDLTAPAAPDRLAGRLDPQLRQLTASHTDSPVNELLPPLKALLRKFRRREMVRIAVRDLAGISDLDDTMADLSALAEATIDGALRLLYDGLCVAHGVPAVGRHFRPFAARFSALLHAFVRFGTRVRLVTRAQRPAA